MLNSLHIKLYTYIHRDICSTYILHTYRCDILLRQGRGNGSYQFSNAPCRGSKASIGIFWHYSTAECHVWYIFCSSIYRALNVGMYLGILKMYLKCLVCNQHFSHIYIYKWFKHATIFFEHFFSKGRVLIKRGYKLEVYIHHKQSNSIFKPKNKNKANIPIC